MTQIESLLRVSDLARLLCCSQRTIWRMVYSEGTPQSIRIGRSVRFRASEIDYWIRLGCPDRTSFELKLHLQEEQRLIQEENEYLINEDCE